MDPGSKSNVGYQIVDMSHILKGDTWHIKSMVAKYTLKTASSFT